tara:strand:- start:331 stop:672 length:342 start_codon:yes stop_codon:yes gene_type:complete
MVQRTKKTVSHYQNLGPFIGIYFGLSLMSLAIKLKLIHRWFNGILIDWWRSYHLNIFIIFGSMWSLPLYKQKIISYFMNGIIYEFRKMMSVVYLIIFLAILKLAKIMEGKVYE